jgi:hypothetical protein
MASSKVSLTTFVDFVLKAGTPKLTVVKTFKDRDDYDPAADYYKPLRNEIVRMHAAGDPKKVLDAFLATVHARKKVNYATAVAGYKKILGKKSIAWFDPPSSMWSCAGIDVSVNPEVGLKIECVDYVLKLYFKRDRLAKNKMEIINHLMAETLTDPKVPRNFGVVDMRNGKLITTPPDPALMALLKGEAAAFATMLSLV